MRTTRASQTTSAFRAGKRAVKRTSNPGLLYIMGYQGATKRGLKGQDFAGWWRTFLMAAGADVDVPEGWLPD